MSHPPATVVQLTPPGRGAVATILVEGEKAGEIVQAVFQAASGRPLQEHAPQRIVFGHLGGERSEEVVVRRRSDRSIEIHCHGGRAAVEMVQRLLVERGCHAASWRDWIAEHAEDAIQAAARIALADARTQRTAAILLDQFHGALRRAIQGIQGKLANGEVQAARDDIRTFLSRAELGLHLTQPWRVVVAGPPNVGKSTLVNALVGYRRAIVDPTAGTTRDVVTAPAAIEGWPVEFSDTAGIRESKHPLERAGIELAKRALTAADLVLLVFDITQPWSGEDQTLTETWPQALVIHNKCDLELSRDDYRPAGLIVSARERQGIDALLQAIAAALVRAPPPPGAAVPFTQDQIDHLWALEAGIDASPDPPEEG